MIDISTATLFAAIVLAGATVVLALATIYYATQTKGLAIQTKDLVIETRKTREYEILPIIKASFSFIGPIYVALKLENVGRGNAIDIEATIRFEPSTNTMAEREWKERVLVQGSHRDFMLREYGNVERLGTSLSRIAIVGEFKDILGMTHTFNETIDTGQFSRNITASEMRLLESVEDYLKDIAKHTESIGSKIDSLSSNVERINTILASNQTRTIEENNTQNETAVGNTRL